MASVTEIVQRLLDNGHINAEEAIILLKSDWENSRPVVTTQPYQCPFNNPAPIPVSPNPYPSPYPNPLYPSEPQIWYGTSKPGYTGTINDNFTSK